MPMIDPNLTLSWSDSKYLTIAGKIYLATKLGLIGVIKLSEQAAILFI